MHKRYTNGFTIVELLVVIVVIAILAAITIVAFRGMQDRARASTVSQGLTRAKRKLELYKIDNGAYPLTGSLADAGISNEDVVYEYTSADGAAYCLTASNGNAIYKITESTVPTSGGCNGHTWAGGVVLTNLVANGDFSSGTSGWVLGTGWSIDTSGRKLIATGASTGQAYRGVAVTNTSIVYFALDVLALASGAVEVHPGGVPTSAGAIANAPGRLSVVYDLKNTAANGNFVVGKYGASVLTSETTRLLAINLTATFGAGNEPTKAQMDTIMQQFPNNWFNGTVTADTRGVL